MATVRTLTFADLLKRYRMAAGYTQEALADAAQLSVRCISDLERGIKRAPRRDTVELLATALRLTERERSLFEACARSHPPRDADTATSGDRDARADAALPPLVGRTADLVAVEHFLHSGTTALFVTGEPGIGKTRLLQEAADRASAAGWTVLRGGTQRLGRLVPYAPLVGAFCRFITPRSHAQRRDDLRGCGWLARLLPELVDGPGTSVATWKMPPEQERRLMFAAAARFLDNVAGPAGTLLILDDLQWAGPDALDLLVTLARGASESSLRLLCAYRDTDISAGDPLAIALADLAHAGSARLLRLGPLTEPAAAELLCALLADGYSPSLAEAVLRQSGGVPFFLVSCAQALQTLGPDAAAQPAAVPWNVTQSVGQRVAALPPAAQELLGAAAVVGRRVSRPLLLALAERAGFSEQMVIDALDAAAQARLLVEERDDLYQFAHELIRDVVISGLSTARRSVLHRHVAEALEERDDQDQPALLAYHFARAGEAAKALLYLERAGDRAAVQAFGAAESYYRDLIAQLDTLGQAVRAGRVREKLGAVLMTAAQYDAALAVFEDTITIYHDADDLEGLCRATAQIGWVHALRGTPAEGIARLQPLPDPLNTSRLSSLGLAQLYVALAQLYGVSGRYNEQLETSERAAKLAAAVKDTTLLARAEMRYGTALLMLGRIEEGFRVLDRAVPAIEATGDLRNLCWAINNIGVVYEVRGDFVTTRRYAVRAVELAERLSDPTVLAFMVHRLGVNAFYMGDWQSAHLDLERALLLTQAVATSATSAYPPLGLGLLCMARGELPAAERYLADAERLARPRGDLQALYLIHGLLAERELLAGDAHSARDRLLQFFVDGGSEPADVAVLLPRLAWAHLQLGELERAEAVAERSVAEATAEHNRFDLVDGLTARALVETRRGRPDAAARTLDTALTLTREMRYPYGEARVLFALGWLHAHQCRREHARAALDAAHAILGRLGERLYAEHVEALLAELAPVPVHAR